MGGFGKLQKTSYVMNTLAQGSAAFFINCFVFLEKKPVYNCFEDGQYNVCSAEEYCSISKLDRRIDWTDPQSIDNLIDQLDFHCEDDIMIGFIGALFLMGIVVGCSTLTRLGDKIGRRPVYLIGLFMHLFFMIGILITKNKYIAYGLLFIFGMSLTARYYVGYTYNLEMQPKSHYVLVSTTMFMFESVVYFFICIYFSFISKQWKILQIPNLVLCISGIIFMLWMPESPKFLVAQ